MAVAGATARSCGREWNTAGRNHGSKVAVINPFLSSTQFGNFERVLFHRSVILKRKILRLVVTLTEKNLAFKYLFTSSLFDIHFASTFSPRSSSPVEKICNRLRVSLKTIFREKSI